MIETLDGTYGWRARIGFLTVASTIETPVYEFQMMAPCGMVLVSAHLTIRRVAQESMEPALEALADVAEELGHYHIDHLVVSGAPLAYLADDPSKASAEIVERAAAAAQVPTTFEWNATVEALRHVGAGRVALASPFTSQANERIAWALGEDGIEVAAAEGMELGSNPEITLEPLRSAYEVSRRAVRRAGDVDALYISCPRWPVAPIIGLLEDELGLPVVASIPAWMWKVMRELGIRTPVGGYGSLLAGGTDAARRPGPPGTDREQRAANAREGGRR